MTQLHNFSIPRIVISGLRGGSGKTILSLCLIASWHRKGLKITPFKKGPDYIDAGWLAKVAGAPCYNLDLFMMTPEQAFQSFISHTYNCQTSLNAECGLGNKTIADCGMRNAEFKSKIQNPKSEIFDHIALIEGNRGLYDGVDHKGTYSTAELAKLLKSPVILIVDSTKATNTIAAMVLGCQKMDSHVSIGGVVLNQVATSRQESLIRKSINDTCKIPVFGAIPRLKHDPFPERHMGLTPFQEHKGTDESIAAVEEIGAQYLDMDAILKVASEATPLSNADCGLRIASPHPPLSKGGQRGGNSEIRNPKSEIKIGIIRDSAFQFYYPDNFEELEKRGAELIEINALTETKLPDIDALYIGGGFPETHAVALSENISFKNSLQEAIEKGLPVYAECGGLMYLGESLILNNKTYPMAGVLPIVFGLEKKPQAHGYTIIEVEKPNPYFSQNIILKGHEFHYSRVLEINTPLTPLTRGELNNPSLLLPLSKGRTGGAKGEAGGFSEQTYMAFNVRRGKGIIEGKDGLCYKNVLATYTHLHALGAPEWSDGLVRCAREFKNQN